MDGVLLIVNIYFIRNLFVVIIDFFSYVWSFILFKN
jgi:hypothetical protein